MNIPSYFDIAYKDGNIWFACDDADSPIKAFATNGTLVDYIWDTVIPAAHGLTFESDSRYLWASDIVNDKIYRIDLSPAGIEDDGTSTSPQTRNLTVDSNPFSSSVVISTTGFTGNAMLEIYNINGNLVHSTHIDNSVIWDGTDSTNSELPPGNYIIRVQDSAGEPLTLKILKF